MVDRAWLFRGLVACWALAVAGAPAAMAQPSDTDGIEVRSGGPVPTLNGVPCVSGHLGTCLSFLQNNPPGMRPVAPRSGVGHSPTVRR
ncbi:hypothetical protein [Mycobacterium sp. 141]|uniref:hypothetical protein n=1 Tax=Mycobacterium sp. 141 TaxID=1120797 RepID=UPI001E344F95|nr:hypothetical protein [Mycobacterium sp. 141]